MNRRLLIVPVVGAAAFVGSQLITGGDSELPPEPVFPTVVGNPTAQDWTSDGWSVNRFVDDPFDPSLSGDTPLSGPPGAVDAPEPAPTSEAELDAGATPTIDSTTTSAPTRSTPTSTTAAPFVAPPTTTAPPLAPPEPGGTDVPAIDDLPGPEDDIPDPDTDNDR